MEEQLPLYKSETTFFLSKLYHCQFSVLPTTIDKQHFGNRTNVGLIFSEWNKNTDNYHVVSINFLGIIKYNKHVNYTIMLLIQLKMIFIDKFSQKRYL